MKCHAKWFEITGAATPKLSFGSPFKRKWIQTWVSHNVTAEGEEPDPLHCHSETAKFDDYKYSET